MTKDAKATPETKAGDKATTEPAPPAPATWVVPEEVVFKAWAEASRVRDLHDRGANPEIPFSLEKAREQWDDFQIAPSAQAFALEILKWAADRSPSSPKPIPAAKPKKEKAAPKNPGK